MRSIIRKTIASLLAGALLCVPAFADSARAQGSASVLIAPSPATVGEGMTTAVEVRVEGVEGLYGLDIRIGFDPAVVEVVDDDAGKAGIQVRAGSLLSVDFVIRNTADNAAGTVWFGLTQLNPSPPVSGSGTAFIIVFKGKQRGSTSPVTITYRQLASRAGEAIPSSAQNGEIRVVEASLAPPTPTIAPPPQQPTVPMPTPEPTDAQPTAKPTTKPTATQAAAPTSQPTTPPTSEPAPRPTAVPPTSAPATRRPDTPAPTSPSAPTATARVVQPTIRPEPTATAPAPTRAATSTPGSGLDVGLILAAMGGVVLLGAGALGVWRLTRRRR